MSKTFIPRTTRDLVAAQAGYRCGYCLLQQDVAGIQLHVEHIIPEAAGGNSEIENLWLACPTCNNHKGMQVKAPDPKTGKIVSLFHPRKQTWKTHFAWSADGLEIVGLTPTGRATVLALKLNQLFMLRARRRWILAGWHPPAD